MLQPFLKEMGCVLDSILSIGMFSANTAHATCSVSETVNEMMMMPSFRNNSRNAVRWLQCPPVHTTENEG